LLAFTHNAGRLATKILDSIGTGYDIHHTGFLPRFAGIPYLNHSQRIVLFTQHGGGSVEDAPALHSRHGRPSLKTLLGTGNGGLHDRFIGLFNLIDNFAGGWIYNVEPLAALVCQGLAVDKRLVDGQRH
jgi:hypothetical protein